MRTSAFHHWKLSQYFCINFSYRATSDLHTGAQLFFNLCAFKPCFFSRNLSDHYNNVKCKIYMFFHVKSLVPLYTLIFSITTVPITGLSVHLCSVPTLTLLLHPSYQQEQFQLRSDNMLQWCLSSSNPFCTLMDVWNYVQCFWLAHPATQSKTHFQNLHLNPSPKMLSFAHSFQFPFTSNFTLNV